MGSTELFQVEENVLELVIKELNYPSLKSFHEDVTKIQQWMTKQPHLPEIMDAKKIQNFLIRNKGSVEKTKSKIDNYYTVRIQLPDIFNSINPKLANMERFLQAGYTIPLPKLTKEMYRMFVFKVRDKSLIENVDPMDALRCIVNSLEIGLMKDVMFGDVLICDCTNLPLSYVLKLTPAFLYKSVIVIYERVFSGRLKGAYFINCPMFLDKLFFVLKAVVKPKLYNRINILSLDGLVEKLGKDILPKDFGGCEKSLEEIQEMLRIEFRENKEHFDRLDQLRVDESLRTEKQNDETLGFHGNFKKLEID